MDGAFACACAKRRGAPLSAALLALLIGAASAGEGGGLRSRPSGTGLFRPQSLNANLAGATEMGWGKGGKEPSVSNRPSSRAQMPWEDERASPVSRAATLALVTAGLLFSRVAMVDGREAKLATLGEILEEQQEQARKQPKAAALRTALKHGSLLYGLAAHPRAPRVFRTHLTRMESQEIVRADVAIYDPEFEPCKLLIKDCENMDDSWHVLSAKETVQVYRKEVPGSQAFVYRARAQIDEKIDDVVTALCDVAHRKDWDPTCVEMRELSVQGDTHVIYWRVKFPFPLADRDYIFSRRVMEGGGGERYMVCRSCEKGVHPEVEGVVRIDSFQTHVALRTTESGTVDYLLEYFEEPKGHVPQWAVNLGMDHAVDGMIEGLKESIRAGALH